VPPAPAIFFLSDYGTADEFVGVVHAVLHRLAPQVPVVDLSHHVAPFDVTGAAAMLDRCAPYLGSGVVLAVVDPGVGTSRRALALRTVAAGAGRGAEGAGPARPAWLVGPDNGLLVPMAEAYGGVGSVVGIDRDGPVLAGHRPVAGRRGDPGPTFDGRDVFAPAAAHLVLGGDPGLLGPELDPASLVTVDPGPPVTGRSQKASSTGPVVLTSVASVDRFGNVQLEVGPAAWAEAGFPADQTVAVTIASGPVPARRVRVYAELGEGELGLLTDGTGHLALVLDRESAAAALHPVEVGAAVRIVPGDG
jgi:S-adenosyl-L-methionine hydrolase (adenosine-forming)